ncbi:MAG: glycosyltransferase [Campylobacterales bacterium]|nr:glycosyltransferase [Campylobacterales bacterium]
MKFSVLISVYYKEKPSFLEEALSSIENQTVKADEIVLVKDGPLTNGLDEVIVRHADASQIPYIVLALEKNVGLGTALAKGVDACRYEWIARMDGDDIAMPDRFEKQIDYLSNHPDIDILGTWISEFEDDPVRSSGERKPPQRHEDIVSYAKYRNPINHMTVMFRKSAVKSVGNYVPMNGFEDYFLWIRLLQKGYRFANINEILVNARTGRTMILRRQGWNYFQNEWNFQKTVWERGFLSMYEYRRNLFLRAVPRLFPVYVLKKVYNALRKV